MSVRPDDGGPAFPQTAGIGDGMSLRDWFAGRALRSVLPTDLDEYTFGGVAQNAPQWAEKCAIIAAAMIAELKKGNGP